MSISIQNCLWLKANALEVASFYCSVFADSVIVQSNPHAVSVQLLGRSFVILNGGQEDINPSLSFFVQCNTAEEVNALWESLLPGGNVMMPLNNYPWSERYGWCSDRFGVNWQLMLHEKTSDIIFPCLMFIDQNNGKAAEALEFYTGIIPDAAVDFVSRYENGEPDIEGNIKHARFTLAGRLFSCMESSSEFGFQFNHASSLVLTCNTQDEIDLLWNSLSAGGSEGQCGWLKDKYGLSWQVVPASLGSLISDPIKGGAAMQRMLQMKKLVISELEL